jgi:hypothetical protein
MKIHPIEWILMWPLRHDKLIGMQNGKLTVIHNFSNLVLTKLKFFFRLILLTITFEVGFILSA